MDLFGDLVWRQLNFSGIQAECEVFNLFAREIPQEELSRIEKSRARQTMVPDFKIMIPTQEGRTEPKLYEMKVIFSCPTRYPCNPRPEGKAVDRRAQLLPGEYTKTQGMLTPSMVELQEGKLVGWRGSFKASEGSGVWL